MIGANVGKGVFVCNSTLILQTCSRHRYYCLVESEFTIISPAPCLFNYEHGLALALWRLSL